MRFAIVSVSYLIDRFGIGFLRRIHDFKNKSTHNHRLFAIAGKIRLKRNEPCVFGITASSEIGCHRCLNFRRYLIENIIRRCALNICFN